MAWTADSASAGTMFVMRLCQVFVFSFSLGGGLGFFLDSVDEGAAYPGTIWKAVIAEAAAVPFKNLRRCVWFFFIILLRYFSGSNPVLLHRAPYNLTGKSRACSNKRSPCIHFFCAIPHRCAAVGPDETSALLPARTGLYHLDQHGLHRGPLDLEFLPVSLAQGLHVL